MLQFVFRCRMIYLRQPHNDKPSDRTSELGQKSAPFHCEVCSFQGDQSDPGNGDEWNLAQECWKIELRCHGQQDPSNLLFHLFRMPNAIQTWDQELPFGISNLGSLWQQFLAYLVVPPNFMPFWL